MTDIHPAPGTRIATGGLAHDYTGTIERVDTTDPEHPAYHGTLDNGRLFTVYPNGPRYQADEDDDTPALSETE